MKKIIVTIGPALFRHLPLPDIGEAEYIYRINGAHGTLEQIEFSLREVRRLVPEPEILIDLPGNKIRTANLDQPIPLARNERFTLLTHQTNYPEFYSRLEEGSVVWANDSTLRFIVESANGERMEFLSKSNGWLQNNKGLHVRGIHEGIPFLLEKDRRLIEIANRHAVHYVGLSFVRTVADIEEARRLISEGIEVISKIETKQAVTNLDSILNVVDQILIDRGDLSAEIGIEKLPAYQNRIVRRALCYNKRIFLATQVLKSMEEKPIPNIAEVIDLYNSVQQGIYGVQLSEETAVGKFPRECLAIIQSVLEEIGKETVAPFA